MLFSARFAHAVIVNTYDWSSVDGTGQTIPQVRVTEMFFTAFEIMGSKLDVTPQLYDNLFVYSVQNLSTNNGIKLFSVPNPGNVGALMFGAAHQQDPCYDLTNCTGTPIQWTSRNEGGRFIWEAPSAFDYIDPGRTLSGFEIFTVYGTAERGVTDAGWAQFLPDVNVYGPVSGPVVDGAAVPEPMTLLLVGSGLAGLVLMRKS